MILILLSLITESPTASIAITPVQHQPCDRLKISKVLIVNIFVLLNAVKGPDILAKGVAGIFAGDTKVKYLVLGGRLPPIHFDAILSRIFFWILRINKEKEATTHFFAFRNGNIDLVITF